MSNALWVNRVGELIVARIRGEPTAELLSQCHEKVISLAEREGVAKVLYDTLEMTAPPVDIPWLQRELDRHLGDVKLRRAIVVPDTKLAYLARLAFGDGDYRVFYEDLVQAAQWLESDARP